MNYGLRQAVSIAGGQKALARLITDDSGNYVSHQAVQQWCSKGYPPLGRVVQIIKAVNHQVTQKQLRPDFFMEEQGEQEVTQDDKDDNGVNGTATGSTGRAIKADGEAPEAIIEQAA